MESPVCAPAASDFRLIETFGFDPDRGFARLDLHLDRMQRSAGALGMGFDRAAACQALDRHRGGRALRVRLTLDRAGNFEVTTAALGTAPRHWVVAIAAQRLRSDDPWLRHKTTRRGLYDRARAALPGGVDEWLFRNERGEICEGTITNLFVTLASGVRVTPPVSSGVLPGILRQSLLQGGQLREAVITRDDLGTARDLQVGNALRGLIRARLRPMA